jgi:ABC-type multidrug transport system fused ATPase/permease subunit
MAVLMSKPQEQKTPIWPSIQRLIQLSGRHKIWLYAAIGINILQTLTVVGNSHGLRKIFEAVGAGDANSLWFYTFFLIILGIIDIPLSYLVTRSIGLYSEKVLADLRHKIAAKATYLPVGYLEERHSGDLLAVVNADLTKLKNLTSNDLLRLIGDSMRGVAALIYLLSVSWSLTLVSLLLTPLMFLLLSRLTQPVARRTEEMQAEIGKVSSIAQDGLSGLMVTKAFNLTAIMNDRLRQANLGVLKKGLSVARLKAIVDGVSYAVGMSPFLITFGYGGFQVIMGQMTFGALLAFINLLNYVANPLISIPGTLASISEGVGAIQRVFHILDQDVERTDGAVAQPLLTADPIIRFKEMTFQYQEGSPILNRVSFDIHKGQTVAIVGPSGGGKSTILKLLLGFYPACEDCIQVFGQDVNHWQLTALRQQMAFVAQDTYLFPVSIAENIACGRLGAIQSEIEAAARLANIHDFIMTLPQSYQTLVGERGARLSGGQKQRISLARAILKDAPVLLLDEATSALDTESEALVQEALERFMVGRTTIVIAHRLSTIINADWVLVLDAGQIVEKGTHVELVARNGLYQELYQRQFDVVPLEKAPETVEESSQ